MSFELCQVHDMDATNGCPKCWEADPENPDNIRRALEERIAFAEQARDNAIKQRDDALERAKAKAKSAGDRITALIGLVRTCVLDRPRMEWVEDRLHGILSKGDE